MRMSCVCAVVLVTFAKSVENSVENSGGVREIGDGLVVSTRYVLKHESFEGSIIDLPNAVTFRVGGDAVTSGCEKKPPVTADL